VLGHIASNDVHVVQSAVRAAARTAVAGAQDHVPPRAVTVMGVPRFPDGPALVFTGAEGAAFLRGVKVGDFG